MRNVVILVLMSAFVFAACKSDDTDDGQGAAAFGGAGGAGGTGGNGGVGGTGGASGAAGLGGTGGVGGAGGAGGTAGTIGGMGGVGGMGGMGGMGGVGGMGGAGGEGGMGGMGGAGDNAPEGCDRGSIDQKTDVHSAAELEALRGYTHISWLTIDDDQDGTLDITNLDALECLQEIDEDLELFSNPMLTNLDGLSQLTTIGFMIHMEGADSLVSVSGLANISTMGWADIAGYPMLPQCEIDALKAAWTANGLDIATFAIADGLADAPCE